MSEAGKSRSSKAKSDTAPKAKSESAGGKTETKGAADSTPAKSADAKSTDGGKESSQESGKSARDSIGGKADVHYGYFSSVRTPAYRSGWDAIWGGKNGDGGADGEEAPRRAAKARKRRDPITVTFDLDELPPPLRDGLIEVARAELRKSRVSYERRDKAAPSTGASPAAWTEG